MHYTERKIAIVGAGISGLLACKYALSKGHHPVVFESQGDLGGVWTNTLETTSLQTPKILYQFSDFPWPSTVEDMFPTGGQVLEYVQSYTEHFGLLGYVRFNTKVLNMEFKGALDQEINAWSLWGGTGEAFGNKGKWTLLLQDVLSHSEQVMQFDFVILCIGRFSDLQNMPEFPPGKGPEVFQGKVMHSKDYSALDNKEARNSIKGRRVAVVGSQKSALDIAFECSIANGKELPCHLIYRSARWNLLDYTAWGFPLPLFFLSRFAELLVRKPGEGLFHSILATFLSPLVNGFYEKMSEGSIIPKKAAKFSFCTEGVVIEGEEKPLEADLVILATGFNGDEKLSNIFASPKFQGYMMGSPSSIVPLYRRCIHPRIPQLAVVGYSESLANLYTSELRCRWVMELLDGTFKLPGIKEMEKDTSQWDKFMKTYAGKHYRRSCIGALHTWYNDQLCKDMGLNPRRKKGFFADLFELYGPLDYANSP